MAKREICIVDDDANVRQSLRVRLEAAGYTVFEAPDADTAIAVINTHHPSLAIIDIVMPDREGLSLIQDLKDRYPKLPIIAISGGGSVGPKDYLELALQFGANAAFAKPLRDADFMAAVAHFAG